MLGDLIFADDWQAIILLMSNQTWKETLYLEPNSTHP